jgi:predicted dehydrogenase
VSSRLHAGGRRLALPPAVVEDYAVAQIDLAGGCVVRLACSWNLPAGRDAVIEAHFHGTRGGAAMRNVGGSFYDFVAERFDGTRARRSLRRPTPGAGAPPCTGPARSRRRRASIPRSSAWWRLQRYWMRSMAAERHPASRIMC